MSDVLGVGLVVGGVASILLGLLILVGNPSGSPDQGARLAQAAIPFFVGGLWLRLQGLSRMRSHS